MTVAINGTNGLVFNDASTQNTAATGFGFKNRLINGSFTIDQRNAGASVNLTDGLYFIDRFKSSISQTSKLTGQRSTVAPVGFVNSLLTTVSTAFTPASGDYAGIVQGIEGFNVADLGWGTANASPVTISFQVRSSVTGTFSVTIHNGAANRSYVKTYTINATNTFETKAVTIPGDTTGTWTTDNSASLTLYFALGMGATFGNATADVWNSSLKLAATGQTQWVSTAGATFYITGVQLEKGSTATSFDYRPYGTELALCQRYCVVYGGESSYERFSMIDCYGTTSSNGIINMPVTMRVIPTLTINAASNFCIYTRATLIVCTSININFSSTKIATLEPNVSSGLTVGSAGQLVANNNTNAKLTLSAEL